MSLLFLYINISERHVKYLCFLYVYVNLFSLCNNKMFIYLSIFLSLFVSFALYSYHIGICRFVLSRRKLILIFGNKLWLGGLEGGRDRSPDIHYACFSDLPNPLTPPAFPALYISSGGKLVDKLLE